MRVFIMKKITLVKVVACVAVLIAAVIYTVTAVSADTTAFSDNGLCLTEVEGANSAVAITIDSSFGEDHTDDLLEILDKYGAKATFAVMGVWAEENPNQVKSMVKGGHEVISHSMTHERYDDLGAEGAVKDAVAARELLKMDFGVDTDLIRTPYGSGGDEVLANLVEKGFTPIGWSVDSQDWKGDGADNIANRVLNNVKNGSIIVLQNNNEQTVEALPKIIEGLYDMNYECVTISKLGGTSE